MQWCGGAKNLHLFTVCVCCVCVCMLCSIVCPDEESPYPITFWTVMTKVRWEAFMWVRHCVHTCILYLCMLKLAHYSLACCVCIGCGDSVGGVASVLYG